MWWVVSLLSFWTFKEKITKSIEDQSRYFLTYTLLSGILLIIFRGRELGIPDEYLSNVTTEMIGIATTVFLIDRIYKYINSKNEELYRKLSLKVCKMPIYTYCGHWLSIFEPDSTKLASELAKYQDLESFFKSDEFYQKIVSFDFNSDIVPDKTYAQYYNEKMLEISDRFQSILSKYASKLSHKDIPLLEHFGGRAYIFTVFAVMKLLSEAKYTTSTGGGPTVSIKPHINSFQEIKQENFKKHFGKLIELINEYNGVVDNDYEKWTIHNINQKQTIKSANNNPATEW